jgi:hypothetical protein
MSSAFFVHVTATSPGLRYAGDGARLFISARGPIVLVCAGPPGATPPTQGR